MSGKYRGTERWCVEMSSTNHNEDISHSRKLKWLSEINCPVHRLQNQVYPGEDPSVQERKSGNPKIILVHICPVSNADTTRASIVGKIVSFLMACIGVAVWAFWRHKNKLPQPFFIFFVFVFFLSIFFSFDNCSIFNFNLFLNLYFISCFQSYNFVYILFIIGQVIF